MIGESCELSFAADPGLGGVIATVRTANIPSQRAFAKAGLPGIPLAVLLTGAVALWSIRSEPAA